MIAVACFGKSDTLKVFIIIISIVICQDPAPDYDLAIKSDSDYFKYYFRPSARYDQKKMDPIKFFNSKYNIHYRVLLEPHLDENYKSYLQKFFSEDKLINLDDLLEKSEKARTLENQPDYMDERYAFENPDYYQKTDTKYYESEIYQTEHNVAKHYLEKTERQPLNEDDYTNLWLLYELMPKMYETGEGFYKARAGLGQYLVDTTPAPDYRSPINIAIDHNYDLDLVKVSTRDVLIRGEGYGRYALRMAYQEKIPLDQGTCNEAYTTEYDNNVQYTYDNV